MSAAKLTRRALLSGVAAMAGQGALAGAPERSLFPVPRPAELRNRPTPTAPAARDVIAEIGLSGKSSFVVADARTGQVLDAHDPLVSLPTASVAKLVTAQYALEALGPAHQFHTRIAATAPMLGGRIDGDLVLLGGGDPMLDSDDLARMAKALKAQGLREVTGRLLVHRGDLPSLPHIDPRQPPELSYNPAVSGLNLNFNRVYFEWKRQGDGYLATMDARAENARPRVAVTRMSIVDRAGPVFAYRRNAFFEDWTVARSALGEEGARWLPVRNPELYAGYALHALLAGEGLRLGPPKVVARRPAGKVLVSHGSMPLQRILRSMLYYSTNLIAEVAGLNASHALGVRPNSLAASAARMNDWMSGRLGARRPRFVDHSGLGDGTRVTTRDLVSALIRIGPDSTLAGMLRRFPMPREGAGIEVVAKTGTLNFVSGLAGFARAGGRDLAFAILAADLPRRAAIPPQQMERPPGAKGWATRARYQDAQLIMEWARRYG